MLLTFVHGSCYTHDVADEHAPTAPQLRSKDPPGRGYTCLGNRLLEEWAQNEPHGVTEACARLGERCGITRQLVIKWRGGGRVPPKHWGTVADVTGIPVEAWETWELLGREEPEPASEERPVVEPDAPLGSTPDELRQSAARLKRLAAQPGLTPAQQAALEGKRVTALTALGRLEERQAIHDHPDAADFLDDVAQALEDVLGPDLPPGLLSRLGDRLAELQAARAAAPRKAAA
jgi:hypothetical protein